MSPPADLDIAIIGGGIGGLYCAQRLAARNPRPGRIGLFEATARLGGRLRTVFADSSSAFPLELGAQNIPDYHALIRALLRELGIESIKNPPEPDSGLVSLRGRVRTIRQIRRARFKRPFGYDVSTRMQRKGPAAIVRKVIAAMDLLGPDALSRVKGALDDRLSEILSAEEIQYLTDRTGYSIWQESIDASAALNWIMNDMFTNDRAMLAIPAGMSSIVAKLASSIRALGGSIDTCRRLVALQSNGDSPVTLQIADREDQIQTVLARQVILALPSQAIDRIQGFAERPAIHRLTQAVRALPTLRGAITYPDAWWRPDFAGGHMQTDSALGLLDHIAMDSAGLAAITFFVDGRRGDHWRNDFAPLPAHAWLASSHPVTLEIHRIVEQLHRPIRGRRPPLPPLQAIVTDWQMDPFGGAFHLWSLNARPAETRRLARQPCPPEPIYICGEAWSARQGWIEGALETVEEILPLLQSQLGGRAATDP